MILYSYSHHKNSGHAMHPATGIDTDRNKQYFHTVASIALNDSVAQHSLWKFACNRSWLQSGHIFHHVCYTNKYYA